MTAQVVAGGLFSSAERKAVNHDQSQRALWVEWDGTAALTAKIVPAADLASSQGLPQTHLLLRLQRADNDDLNAADVPTDFAVSLVFEDGSRGDQVAASAHLPTEQSALLGPVGGA